MLNLQIIQKNSDPDNKKPVVVSGCLTQSDKPITQMLLTKYSPRVSVLGVQQIHRIAEVMQQAFEVLFHLSIFLHPLFLK